MSRRSGEPTSWSGGARYNWREEQHTEQEVATMFDPDDAIRRMGRATRFGDWPEVVRLATALQAAHNSGTQAPSVFLAPKPVAAMVPAETPRYDDQWW